MNILIGALGLIILLAGLIFQAIQNLMIAIPLTGIGGSILATAIVNWVLNRRADNILIAAVLEALSDRSQLMRIDQELDLTFSMKDEYILLQKVHRFRFRNMGMLSRRREISMFTDSASWKHPAKDDGFIWVEEPSGNKLEGNDLECYLSHEFGKVYFRKIYTIARGISGQFEFNSKSLFRGKDRLIWTVQDFSDRFRVRIVNRTGSLDCFAVKINHHKEREIADLMCIKLLEDGSQEIHFEINADILPYQGFEIMWDIGRDYKILTANQVKC
jgi:hypothetical protein